MIQAGTEINDPLERTLGNLPRFGKVVELDSSSLIILNIGTHCSLFTVRVCSAVLYAPI
jgi:hypothetical protein